MPFICAFCQAPIKSGESVVTDGVSSIAHDSCVKKEAEVQKQVVHLPSVTVTPLIQDSQTVGLRARVSGPGFGNPTASVEPCLMPTLTKKVCVECHKPAISICPGCREYVHQDYGYNGANCSGRHEGRCDGARESRSPKKSSQGVVEQVKTVVESMVPLGAGVFLAPKNGAAKPKAGKKGRR